MSELRFTIFEAVNDTLKEIYVGMTALGMHHVIIHHRNALPSEIAHWTPAQAISYRSVEFNLAASHAAGFIAAHARTLSQPGWTIILGSDEGRRR